MTLWRNQFEGSWPVCNDDVPIVFMDGIIITMTNHLKTDGSSSYCIIVYYLYSDLPTYSVLLTIGGYCLWYYYYWPTWLLADLQPIYLLMTDYYWKLCVWQWYYHLLLWPSITSPIIINVMTNTILFNVWLIIIVVMWYWPLLGWLFDIVEILTIIDIHVIIIGDIVLNDYCYCVFNDLLLLLLLLLCGDSMRTIIVWLLYYWPIDI